MLLANAPRTLVDCTLGRAGHAERLLELAPALKLIGLDVDEDNLAFARERLARFDDRITLRHADFAQLGAELAAIGLEKVDGILADLGISSNQISDPLRGLSFDNDGPLDMRLDRRQKTTAADLINSLGEGELSDLLWFNAEERHSRKIAKRLCAARRQGRINSTVLLARLVAAAVGENPDAHRSKTHPATKTFMALRMAVNSELDSLKSLLSSAPSLLAPNGRIAIISFHSGEDRLVKESFRDLAKQGRYRILTKKPMISGEAERVANPRCRSAKLRVAELSAIA
ncbi:MAG: 16S rRNA (cytosine(1402)-N(4))-methyltransferase RsmH [Phycisphaerales bacterium]|nr:16S rRNA (cytosine(1402)-N(4))-methyltransferase RsmH [Phycisphaerales bacterium]